MIIDSTINSHQNMDETSTEDITNEQESMQDTSDDVDNSQMNETSRMALIDAIDAGRKKIEGMSIATHRKNVKQMRDSHHNFSRNTFESVVRKMETNGLSQCDHITNHVPSDVSGFEVNFNR